MSSMGLYSQPFATLAKTKGAAGPEMGASSIAGAMVYKMRAARDAGLGTGT